jgi:hypothetical protein
MTIIHLQQDRAARLNRSMEWLTFSPVAVDEIIKRIKEYKFSQFWSECDQNVTE